MSKFCITCGNPLEEGATTCSKCGAPVTDAAPAQGGTTVVVNQQQPQKGNGMAVAGLIVSIVSFILCCGSLSWLSLIFSIIGAVNAKKLMGKGKGMSIAGIIISALGLIYLIVVIFVFPLLGWASIQDQIENEWQNIQDYDSTYDSDYDLDDYDFDYGS